MNSTFGKGYSATAPSEQMAVLTPRGWKGDGTKTGIVYCHSWQALSQFSMFPTPGTSTAVPAMQRWLTDCGWPVIGGDLSGDPWGNNTGTARVEDCRTYLQSTLGAKSGKVVLFAWSEGGCIAMNYARVHPTNVAAMVLLQPASDLNDLYINNRGIGSASLDAAFPPNWDNTADSGYSPVNFAASLAGIPTLICYATDDTTILPSGVQTVIAGIGSSCTVMTGTGNHGDGYLATVDPRSISSWLTAQGL